MNPFLISVAGSRNFKTSPLCVWDVPLTEGRFDSGCEMPKKGQVLVVQFGGREVQGHVRMNGTRCESNWLLWERTSPKGWPSISFSNVCPWTPWWPENFGDNSYFLKAQPQVEAVNISILEVDGPWHWPYFMMHLWLMWCPSMQYSNAWSVVLVGHRWANLTWGPSCPTKEQKLVRFCFVWWNVFLIGWIFGWLVVFVGWLDVFLNETCFSFSIFCWSNVVTTNHLTLRRYGF